MNEQTDEGSSGILIELQLFPGIAYFLAMISGGKVVLDAAENYQKSSFRNRFHIATTHGPVRLSVPLLKGKHQQMPITEVLMDGHQSWRENHWRTIQTAYGKSPFFEFYRDDLERRYADPEQGLFAWSLNNMAMALKWLGLEPEMEITHKYYSPGTSDLHDLRGMIRPGRDSYWSTLAESMNYEQVFTDRQGFQANMSILDLVFCLGPEAGARLKKHWSEQTT